MTDRVSQQPQKKPSCACCGKTAQPGWAPAVLAYERKGKDTYHLCSECIEGFMFRCLQDGIFSIHDIERWTASRQ